jgi:hypothetical protein
LQICGEKSIVLAELSKTTWCALVKKSPSFTYPIFACDCIVVKLIHAFYNKKYAQVTVKLAKIGES